MFDFSNAYTTVPGWVLELAMRRLHMPEGMIDLMVGLVEGQVPTAKTAVGHTRCFAVEGGLPQGDPASPIFWAIVADPILSMLSKGGGGAGLGHGTAIEIRGHMEGEEATAVAGVGAGVGGPPTDMQADKSGPNVTEQDRG
jgi:hypothetical protein